ncbi:NACHT domain-containing protein [Roseateles chitinivorans]|uniref:NACHT domain-containing protein n=1 Tax=Roseateles chitinivorans TaxID=2917965 RepID=UPI003D677FDD
MDKDERSSMGQKAEPSLVPIPVVENAPPQLTGGEGFSFEDAVGALYLAALLGEHPAPGLNESTIVRVAFQQGPHGHPLDDLVVTGRGADGSQMRLDAQVKRKLVISAAESNRDFRETVLRAHQTVADASFQLLRDRVGAITGQIASASKHDFENLCEMARAEAQAQMFAQKIRAPHTAGQKLDHFEAVQAILRPYVPTTDLDHATHRLLSHFVLIKMDMLAEGSVLESQTISQLGRCLPDEEQAHASTLWRRLTAAVRLFQGRAAGLDRATLVASFKGSVRLRGAPSLTGAMSLLRQEAELALEEISDQIADVTIARDALVQKVRAAAAPGKFVQLTGSPGVGKSAVLRALVSQAHASGSTLFFKSDRLVGSNWAQYAQLMGLVGIDLEAMLVEIGSTGTPILFVDGIDRIEVNQRKVVLDVLNRILASEHLRNWAVVATARDTGLEHIRTWLPSRLLAAGLFEVAVKELSDDEATILADAVPALSAGLFGPEPLKSLMRRPFFAAILAKEASRSSDFPVSEIGLADLWWRRGGYASDQAHAHQRQNALVEMASAGAVHLGRRISMRQIDPVALAALVADGVVREVRAGHQVQFTHDIFFEWAFLQLLVAQAEDWPSTVCGAGEPPALGRVVELLSQLELTRQGQGWGSIWPGSRQISPCDHSGVAPGWLGRSPCQTSTHTAPSSIRRYM